MSSEPTVVQSAGESVLKEVKKKPSTRTPKSGGKTTAKTPSRKSSKASSAATGESLTKVLSDEAIPTEIQPDEQEEEVAPDEVLKNEKAASVEAVPVIQTAVITDEEAIASSNTEEPKPADVVAQEASTKSRKKRVLDGAEVRPRVKKVKVDESPVVSSSISNEVLNDDVPVHEPRVRRKLSSDGNTDEKRVRKNIEQSIVKSLMNETTEKTLERIAPTQSKVIMKKLTDAKTAEETSHLLGLRAGELKRNRVMLSRIHGGN